jgi:ABC-type transport system involved in multi-copper enzyme maturation permease subunit
MSATRIKAILQKELRDYRRTTSVVGAMTILPLIFVAEPLIQIFSLPASSADTLAHADPLLYMLGIPALVPAALAASTIVGERQLGTLEPVLSTPIRREEFLLAKALAVLVPAMVVSYGVFALSVISIELFAHPAVASTVLRGPELLAQVLFTPLLAAWSIWVAIAISVRTSDLRAAQQLSMLASLPTVVVAALFAFGVIHATLGLALGLAAALLLFNIRGWRVVSPMLDRERLITGHKSKRR